MTFEVTRDYALIKSVLTIPAIYAGMHDDFSGPPETWEMERHPAVSYIAVRDGGELLGITVTAAHSMICVEAHNALLPHVGWKRRLRAAKEFWSWLAGCGCRRVIGKVPANNRYAIAFNKAAGMKIFGINEKAFMKDGGLQDEVWFGLSLPLGDN